MKKISIHWFRNDLRINENPSLKFAAENGKVIPIFIHDTVNNTQKEFNIGEASAWWLHYSLAALNKSLDEKVNFFSGDPFKIIKLLITNFLLLLGFWILLFDVQRLLFSVIHYDVFGKAGIRFPLIFIYSLRLDLATAGFLSALPLLFLLILKFHKVMTLYYFVTQHNIHLICPMPQPIGAVAQL